MKGRERSFPAWGRVMMVGKKVRYTGRVHGVGFRYTACRIAASFPVAGYVRNLPDGDLSGVQLSYEETRENCIPLDSSLFHTVDWPSLRIWAESGGTETILVVEDEPVLRDLAQLILHDCGYRVLDAGSGVEALTVWQSHEGAIDLLLTDMIMPDGLSGKDLAESLVSNKPDRKNLGSHLLFREALELGYRINPVWQISAFVDHVSNAGFARYNQSINDVGARLGIRF